VVQDEVKWSYMPSGFDDCSGVSADDPNGHAYTFGHQDPAAGLIGATYWRRRFTSYVPDGTFATPRASGAWAHAGVQGPTLRAAVGDELRVRVRNRSRLPASLHLHGIPLASVSRVKGSASAPSSPSAPASVLDSILSFFSSLSSGSSASGVVSPTTNSAANDPFSSGSRRSVCSGPGCASLSARSLEVAPGETIEYSWQIPASAGPGPNSAQSSAGRLYSSLAYEGHNDPALAGLLVVLPPGGGDASSPDALPPGVAAERLALFSVSMEHASPYLALNVLDFVWRARLKSVTDAWPAGGNPAASAAVRQLAVSAGAPSAPAVPVPAGVTPAALLAALYNAAARAATENPSLLPSGGLSTDAIDETHSDVIAAVGSLALAPSASVSLPPSLLGLNLGATPATLKEGALVDATALAGSINLLDATGFVARFGQRALEAALAPLALEQLTQEPSFDEGEFQESNTMHGLNGLMYCGNPRDGGAVLPTAILGKTTRWYVGVLGTEVDLHAAHWHGNTLLQGDGNFRTDSIMLLPRQIETADMVAHARGRWLFHCHVTDHIEAGMMTVYEAVPETGSGAEWAVTFPAGSTAADPAPAPIAPAALASELKGRVREYFVQAELRNWSYLDGDVTGRSVSGGSVVQDPACSNMDLAAFEGTHHNAWAWAKVRFIRYTDATFSTRWQHSTPDEAARWAHLALLGPVLRAEVGDTIRVTFRNAAPAHFSLHPHGVVYPKGAEGAPYIDGSAGVRDRGDDMVAPGETWPYTWFVPESAGPGPGDPSSVPWLYHGHVHEAGDENTGLVGVILVTGKGRARVPGSANEADLRPADVDRELVVMAKAFDESQSSEEVHAAGHLLPAPPPGASDDYSLFFTLNGLVACRLSFNATQGDRVRLYGVSLGNEVDLHHIDITGHSLMFRGERVAGLSLLPGTMFAADTVLNAAGDWLITSSVIHHAERGMVARLAVRPPAGASVAAPSAPPSPATGKSLRSYYVQAEEVVWDYTPAGTDKCVLDAFKAANADLFPAMDAASRHAADGTDLQAFTESVRGFIANSDLTIGRVYKKARYVSYTNEAFTVADASSKLGNGSTGILGPTMRAAAGDVLRVVFRNSLAFAVNLAFAGSSLQLAYLRTRAAGSGAAWTVVTGSASVLAARPVQPHDEVEMFWTVPATAAPGPSDPPTIAWTYSSTVSVDHLYAGLAGGLVVAADPAALVVGAPQNGAQREYVLAWFISNENRSPFLDDNILEYTGTPLSVNVDDEGFQESNLKHAVNGLLSCNLNGLTATVGETARFHLLGLGSELDLHTPQVHGMMARTGAVAGGAAGRAGYVATMGVHPGARSTVDVAVSQSGAWMLECGVNDHWTAGMRAQLVVQP
jgi:FtsP/CotA-like multicopper oxidase with cupredoxin domain